MCSSVPWDEKASAHAVVVPSSSRLRPHVTVRSMFSFPSCVLSLALPQCIRDHLAPCGPETIVVQFEHGKAPAVREKGHDGVDAASAESVVGEVELVEGGVLLEGVAERTERKGDLGDETTREDAGEVGDLCL
jgi:hypothetical protein